MPVLQRTVRSGAIAFAGLFIGLCLLGIIGTWWMERLAANMARTGFGLVENAVGVVDAGVARMESHIATSRKEVRQAAETIAAIGRRVEANSPVLSALNERLETSLAPRFTRYASSGCSDRGVTNISAPCSMPICRAAVAPLAFALAARTSMSVRCTVIAKRSCCCSRPINWRPDRPAKRDLRCR